MKISIATYNGALQASAQFIREEALCLFPDAESRCNQGIDTYITVSGEWGLGFEFIGNVASVKFWPKGVDPEKARVYKVTFNNNPRYETYVSISLSPSFFKIPKDASNKRYEVSPEVVKPNKLRCKFNDFIFEREVHRAKFSKKPNSLAPKQAAPPPIGERQLMSGMLSVDTSFKLLVSGPIGELEIDMLIRKLQLDKSILAGK